MGVEVCAMREFFSSVLELLFFLEVLMNENLTISLLYLLFQLFSCW